MLLKRIKFPDVLVVTAHVVPVYDTLVVVANMQLLTALPIMLKLSDIDSVTVDEAAIVRLVNV